MNPGLPPALAQAVTELARTVPLPELRRTVECISENYRGRQTRAWHIESNLEAIAYAAYRMPATYAAIQNVIGHVEQRLPEWAPRTMLDVGVGTGAGFWAAGERWPSLASMTGIDAGQSMIDVGKRLASHASIPAITNATWIQGDFHRQSDRPTADLVVASYIMNELQAEELDDAVERLWSASAGALVVVEPGTPAGFDVVRQVRRRLIALDATIVAPCPHNRACPMEDGDWCHFAARLPRSKLHLSVKPGERGFEDEKFSYVVATRGLGSPGPARILRHPVIFRKRINLTLCAPDVLGDLKLTRRRDHDRYRRARDSSWGDEFPVD